MTKDNDKISFSNRDFIALIRAALAGMGRSDIAIERSWIDEDEPGYPFLVRVPVGTELTVPLMASDDQSDFPNGMFSETRATEFAKALVNLKSAESMLIRYARDIRRAANATVAAARADGLDVLLETIGFRPTYAQHLTQSKCKDAVQYILAAVTIRHTSFYLRPTVSELWVGEPADMAKELADILEEQRERQNRLAELDALGADLIVEQITLDLLTTHGIDVTEVLERVWKEQCVNLTVDHLGHETSLSLITFDGKVSASITLKDAIWNGKHLWFLGDEQMKDHTSLIGQSVGDLVKHPVFSSRPIVDIFHRHADHVVYDLSDKLLFDADSRRLSPLRPTANDNAGEIGSVIDAPLPAMAC